MEKFLFVMSKGFEKAGGATRALQFAAIAAAGDLGVTSGPWWYREIPEDAPATGHFVSVWRRTSDGTWQVVFDAGISHPPLYRYFSGDHRINSNLTLRWGTFPQDRRLRDANSFRKC